MDVVLKKRLVGTAVLLLLAAILWPILFRFDVDQPELQGDEWRNATSAIDAEIAKLKVDTDKIKSDILGEKDAAPGDSNSDNKSQTVTEAETENSTASVADSPRAFEQRVAAHPRLEMPNSIEDLIPGEADDLAQIKDPNLSSAGRGNSRPNTKNSRLDENGLPISWVIQLATFQRWSNAEQLLNQLLDDNYRAFLRPERESEAPPYALYVGPDFELSEARRLANEIASRYKTGEPLVRRFKSGQQ